MEIKKLASPQLNYGNYLKDDQLAFKPGSYSFDLNTSSASYEFQFNVNPDDTNRSVQDKLASFSILPALAFMQMLKKMTPATVPWS